MKRTILGGVIQSNMEKSALFQKINVLSCTFVLKSEIKLICKNSVKSIDFLQYEVPT